MKMNLTKMMMIVIMITSTMTAISSSSVLMMWMMMEINMMSFLPILTSSKKMKDQPMKYFIIQSLASSAMLMSILMNSMIELPLDSSILLMSSMLMKMGLMPFHLWVPMIMAPMSWETCLIMISLQKIIPTVMISQLTEIKLLMISMCTTMILAPISAIKQTSLKKIMAYSSISNSPWMVTSMMNSKSQFLTFFSIYTLINLMIMKKFKEMNLMFMNQMNQENSQKKISIITNMLSISGMPPMMGFFPKWMIMQSTTSFSIMITMSMMMSSLISTFIYMKMISPALLMMATTKKTKSNKNKMENDINLNIMGTMVMMTIKSN